MFYKLLHRKIDANFIRVLCDPYKKTIAKAGVNGIFRDFIYVETGVVNQGGPHTPDCSQTSDLTLRYDSNESCGVFLDYLNILSQLLWADDLILVSTTLDKLQSSIGDLGRYCSWWQLIVNTMKTKIMVFGPNFHNLHSLSMV